MEPQLFLISDTATAPTPQVAAIGGAEAAEPSAAHTPSRWRLDDITRAVGHRGVAEARAALKQARAQAADSSRQPVHQPAA